jgi:hypothetical protein
MKTSAQLGNLSALADRGLRDNCFYSHTPGALTYIPYTVLPSLSFTQRRSLSLCINITRPPPVFLDPRLLAEMEPPEPIHATLVLLGEDTAENEPSSAGQRGEDG